MRAVAVVGYKGSGKTAVAEALVRGLRERGYGVAAIKHAHGGLKLPESDSARLFRAGALAVFTASEEACEVVERRRLELWEALSLLRGYDYAVVEGYKSRFPGYRVVVARTVEEALYLSGPLVLAYSGPVAASREACRLRAPVVDVLRDSERLVEMVEEKAFEPPAALECGACRYGSCLALAEAVARGEARVEECVALHGDVVVVVDGRRLPLNPFVQRLLRNIVMAVVGSLKGAPPAPTSVEVRLQGLALRRPEPR